MELYTRLNEQEIGEVLQQFEIGPIISFKLLDGGFENTNYLIISAKKNISFAFANKNRNKKRKNSPAY